MRIAISGSACQGKSTLVNDFLRNWPMYKRSAESYRSVIKEKDLKLNKEADQASQWEILNCLLNDLNATSSTDNIVFDRCPLDNIVYSLWCNAKNSSDIDDDFIKKCIPLVQEAMHKLDVIFFLPITKVAPVPLIERDNRDIDTDYISEIDNIFKVISHGLNKTGKSPFFPEEDRPPIIEIFGNQQERIEMIKLYVADTGGCVEGGNVFTNEAIEEMEALLGIQNVLGEEAKRERKLRDEIIRDHK